jgi:hypothetical protein
MIESAMCLPQTEPIPFDRLAATPKLGGGIAVWQEWLASTRRLSPHTLTV